MDTAKDTPAEQHRMEKEDIEDLGTVTLSRGGHVIHCLTVIGQIEGHTEAPVSYTHLKISIISVTFTVPPVIFYALPPPLLSSSPIPAPLRQVTARSELIYQ